MQHRRTNQGGSVLTFIIIGAVLATAVVGGAYLLHQRSQQPTKPASTTSQSGSTTQPQSAPPSSPQSSGTASGSSGAPVATTPQSGKLPATGPADTLFQLMAVACLTGVGVAYFRSRRLPGAVPSL